MHYFIYASIQEAYVLIEALLFKSVHIIYDNSNARQIITTPPLRGQWLYFTTLCEQFIQQELQIHLHCNKQIMTVQMFNIQIY